MATMRTSGYAAQSLGMVGADTSGQTTINDQLNAQLDEQRKKRKLGIAPGNPSMQFLSPAAADLASTGLLKTFG